MSDTDLVIARWRANTLAAGIDLPDAIIDSAQRAGSLDQIIALEALLRRLDPGLVMPDALARPWDRGDEHA